ncbi:MAG: hypothetical protein K6G83_16455 [Lachnospiraceae bacterium]|nr:hypothetical protein [Lachnospiraceae bacterium]
MQKGKRKRKRGTIAAILLLFAVFAAAAVSFFLSRRPYGVISLKDCYLKSLKGYDGKGSFELTLDEGKLKAGLFEAMKQQENSIFAGDAPDKEAYLSFADTVSAKAPAGSLKNGDTAELTYDCDMALAGRLNLKITGREETVTVSGLNEARTITTEELFQDVSLSFAGASPRLTLTVVNNSEDDFIRDIVFHPAEEKPYYALGDRITLRAYFGENECMKRQIVTEKPSAECLKVYEVSDTDRYVGREDILPASFLTRAVEAGKAAFTDANAYGVRVFIEAGLVPIYVNKQATFQWKTPEFYKAFYKTIKPGSENNPGVAFNMLDLIYTCDMTQADGVTTSARAVVRFENIIKRADGTYDCDLSDPSLISASHIASNITQVVIDYSKDDYFVEEAALN